MKSIIHQTISSEAGFAGSKTGGGRWRVAIHVLDLAVLLSFVGCSRHLLPPLGGGQAVLVTVAVAVETNVPVQLQAIGHVTAISTVAVQSRVDGFLEEVHFQEGEAVKEGSLIFTIDPRPFQVALNKAKANLERDKAMTQYEEINARRNAELFHQGIIPQDTYDRSRAVADALAAAVATDEAAVDNAQLQLSFCDIRSPINGRTGLLKVNAGNWVKNLDTVLVTINQLEPIYVDFSVPEHELPRICGYLAEAGKLHVTARVAGCEQNPSVSELTNINNAVDADTGMILLRAIFPNKDELLLPGQLVNTVLTLTTLTNTVMVPSQSVQVRQQGRYVFVVKPDSTVEARPVEVGNQVGSETVLRKGVESGEQVVTSGQIRLAPGMKVRIQNPKTVASTMNRGISEKPGSSQVALCP